MYFFYTTSLTAAFKGLQVSQLDHRSKATTALQAKFLSNNVSIELDPSPIQWRCFQTGYKIIATSFCIGKKGIMNFPL